MSDVLRASTILDVRTIKFKNEGKVFLLKKSSNRTSKGDETVIEFHHFLNLHQSLSCQMLGGYRKFCWFFQKNLNLSTLTDALGKNQHLLVYNTPKISKPKNVNVIANIVIYKRSMYADF